MDLLNELLLLYEAEEKNLIGRKISGKEITNKPWPGDFYCDHLHLTSLEGTPVTVGGNFWCKDNDLTSLKDIHKILKNMNGTFWASRNPIKSHVLGLLLIKGCGEVKLDNYRVQTILNKHLPNTKGNKGLLDC
jgi:hypothetical protein